jgi:iron complex outermembrane receptor protein
MKLWRFALSSALVVESLCCTGRLMAADEVLQLNPFEVRSGAQNDSYRATETISASGIALPIRELPIPVDVVTRQLLEDRGVSDLLGASQLFPGVSTGGPVLNGQESWRIHGYSAPGLRNGFRLDNDTTNASEMERIEVARGPTSVLYGSGATGGVINRVTKKPQFKEAGEVTVGFGTFDFYQGMIDVTGPLDFQGNGKPTLAYRAILSREHNTSDQDWFESTRTSYNGSLRWQPTDRLMFTAEFSRNEKNNSPWIEVTEGTDAGGAIAFVKDPTHRGYQFSIQGPDTHLNMTGDVLELQGNVNITRDLILNVGYVNHTSEMNDLRARRIDLWAQGKPAQLEQGHEVVDQDLWKVNLLWNWSNKAVSNKFMAGYEHSHDNNQNLTQRTSNWVPPADFTITQAALDLIHAANPSTNRNQTTILEAYRATDFVTMLGGKLHAMAGLRQDQDVKQQDSITKANVTLQGGTTYQVGAVYDVTKAFSLFANNSTDFVANTQFGPGNVILDPSRGKSFTVGVKFGLLEDKLTGELSYFNERRTNIPNRIGQTTFFELTGEDQSKGWDFNFDYDATKNLQVMFGGSFFNAKTISNPADVTQVGLPPQDVCPSSLFWQSTYKFTEAFKGFSVGLGGFWHNDYPTESATTKRHERTDDVVIWDAFARYSFKIDGHDAHLALTVTNLTDKRGYILVQETFGPPRMVRGTFTYEF